MNYIIFDLEATCEKDSKNFKSEIIEIGAVKIDEHRRIVDEFASFIKPKIYSTVLTDFCKELTTITQDDVERADGFEVVLDRYLSWIGNEEFILCSWGFYDKSQFKKDCEAYGCSTTWLSRHISLKHQHGAKVMGKSRGVGMETALREAGLSLAGVHHRGIDDARNIAQLFQKYFDLWDFSQHSR